MQQNKLTNFLIAIVALLALVVGAGSYYFLTKPKELQVSAIFPKLNSLPSFKAYAHTGDDFSEQNFYGTWSIVFFGFTTCPDICPTTMSDMNQLALGLDDEMKKSTQFVFVSVDPERDTVAKLAQYVPAFNKDFIGVHADLEQVKRLTKNLGVSFMKTHSHDNNPDNYMVDHTARWFIVDPLARRHALVDPSPLARPKDKSLAELVLSDYQSIRQQAKK